MKLHSAELRSVKLRSNIKMYTIFMNSENCKTFVKLIVLSNLTIYCTWKNINSSYNNNRFTILAPTWNDKFKLPDGSYFVSNIQDYSEYILKKHGENIDKPSIKIYVNKVENRITFKIKNG